MKRKEIAILIAILAFSIVGCGESSSAPARSTTASSPEESSVTDNAEAETADFADDAQNEEQTDKSTGNDEEDKVVEENLTQFEKLFSEYPHVAYDENGNGGYIDINGDWVIAPQYSEIRSFSDGYAAVKDSTTNLWGYIDSNGNMAIAPRFVTAKCFMDGRAVVSPDSEYTNFGMIDTSGKYLIEPVYEELSNFKEGYAIAKDPESDLYRFMNEKYEFVFGGYFNAFLFDDGKAVVAYDKTWYVMNENGDLQNLSYEIDSFNSYYGYGDGSIGYVNLENGGVVKTYSGQYAMIDEDGNIISPYYDYLSSFSGDYAIAGNKIDGKLLKGYLDRDFNWFIEPQFDEAYNFLPDYALVQKHKEIDYANYDAEYESQHLFDNWVLIDKNGNDILDAAEHNGIKISAVSLSRFMKEKVPMPAYKNLSDDPTDIVKGYVDWNYNEVIPFQYDSAGSFSSDGSYALVGIDNKYGYIDSNGNWLIEPKFSSLDEQKSSYIY